MNNTSRGLSLTRSHVDKIFPKLTPEQIRRIAARGGGHMHEIQIGEVLVEQGDSAMPFFVVVSGELEVLRPSGGVVEILVTVHSSGEFTEVHMLSGRRTLVRIRVIKPGKVIQLAHQNLSLLQSDAELGEIIMRAFILRSVELAEQAEINIQNSTKEGKIKGLIWLSNFFKDKKRYQEMAKVDILAF
jgi:thioredoxin reductase (NADPH)